MEFLLFLHVPLQAAEKQVEKATQVVRAGKPEEVETALDWLEEVLEGGRRRPHHFSAAAAVYDKAMEVKARALLRLKRYREVVEILHSHVPSLGQTMGNDDADVVELSLENNSAEGGGGVPHSNSPANSADTSCSSPPHPGAFCSSIFAASSSEPHRDDSLDSSTSRDQTRRRCRHYSCFYRLPAILCIACNCYPSRQSRKMAEKQQLWRNLVLGQACWHLGMLEDAMALLQRCKHTASAASRRRSNCMTEDIFFCSSDQLYCRSQIMSSRKNSRGPTSSFAMAGESEIVAQILNNIKFLLRRRAAAVAALDAGLYTESVRHFSKLIDGRRASGTPQGFIAECYLHRAIAYQAIGRVVDAIADCNRSLALNPQSAIKALSVRASLYEMVRCYSDCLLDLQQLKMIYEASLRYRMMQLQQQERSGNGHGYGGGSSFNILWAPSSSSERMDFAGGLDYINGKITATRQRLSRNSGDQMIDAHTILQMPRNCSREDVQRAYLLLSLKHKADRSSQLPCGAASGADDGRGSTSNAAPADMAESVKEEAAASAARLAQLIHKAYLKLLSAISERELEAESRMAQKMRRGQLAVMGMDMSSCFGLQGTKPNPSAASSFRSKTEGGGGYGDAASVEFAQQQQMSVVEEEDGRMAHQLASVLSDALRKDVSQCSDVAPTWAADWAVGPLTLRT